MKYFWKFPPDLRKLARATALKRSEIRGCVSELLVVSKPITIERVIFPPSMEIRPHRHPNASALDYGIFGSGTAFVSWRKIANDDRRLKTTPVYVPRGVLHGGTAGDRGAVCISIVFWHREPLESIGLDWIE